MKPHYDIILPIAINKFFFLGISLFLNKSSNSYLFVKQITSFEKRIVHRRPYNYWHFNKNTIYNKCSLRDLSGLTSCFEFNTQFLAFKNVGAIFFNSRKLPYPFSQLLSISYKS